jgi:hypothetical protein
MLPTSREPFTCDGHPNCAAMKTTDLRWNNHFALGAMRIFINWNDTDVLESWNDKISRIEIPCLETNSGTK